MTVLVPTFLALSLLAPLLGAEDRPYMKRIDVSPAVPDDGAWLEPSR